MDGWTDMGVWLWGGGAYGYVQWWAQLTKKLASITANPLTEKLASITLI